MRRGVAVVLTLGILLVLFLLTLGSLCIFRFWQRSAFKVLCGRQALRWAKAGVEDAIWELDHDERGVDSYEDSWWTAFSGGDVDANGDGIRESRWIEVRGRDGRIRGRYAVAVEDESGRININAVGTPDGSFNEGWSPAEIALLPHLIGPSGARAVALFRYGKDCLPGVSGIDDNRNAAVLDRDGIDNDGDGLIDEPGEGTDEPGEFRCHRPFGDDRPYFTPEEIRMAPTIGSALYLQVRNAISVYSYDENRDRQGRLRIPLNGASYEQIVALLVELGYGDDDAAQIAANILDYRDPDGIPTHRVLSGGRSILGIDTAPFLNEMDVVVPVSVEVGEAGAVTFTEEGGQFIEIFNPWDRSLDIGGWTIAGAAILAAGAGAAQDISAAGRIVIPQGTTIPPRGFFTIGDSVRMRLVVSSQSLPVLTFLPCRLPAGCNLYQPILTINPGAPSRIYGFLRLLPLWVSLGDGIIQLRDATGALVDQCEHPVDSEEDTTQKNDPRIRSASGWLHGSASPGRLNAVFQPWVGGELERQRADRIWPSSFVVRNGPFAVVGELSLIHRGTPWRTLDLWRDGTDRPLMDRCTAVQDPAVPVMGRLNLNTASETALLCLPLFDRPLSAALISARPFPDISGVLGITGGDGSMGLLSREMTRYGVDSRDNDGDGCADTDREREMVFYKICNLITVRSPVFSISVVGQQVRDRNGDGTIGGTEVLGERRLRVWYDRSTGKVLYRKEW